MPLPSIYTTAFDLAQPVGGKITVLAINKILSVSGLPPATVDKVCQEKFRGRLDWVHLITNPAQERSERKQKKKSLKRFFFPTVDQNDGIAYFFSFLSLLHDRRNKGDRRSASLLIIFLSSPYPALTLPYRYPCMFVPLAQPSALLTDKRGKKIEQEASEIESIGRSTHETLLTCGQQVFEKSCCTTGREPHIYLPCLHGGPNIHAHFTLLLV